MSDSDKIQALENFITNPDSKDLDNYIKLSPSQKVDIQSIKIPSNSGNNFNKSRAFRAKAARIAALLELPLNTILTILNKHNITSSGMQQGRSRKTRSKRNRSRKTRSKARK
jgi:hypothetical protein